MLAIDTVLADLQPDPVSPPPTELGAEPAFNSTLARAHQDWLFLFEVGETIVATDIYGQHDMLILDIVEATNHGSSELLAESSSPDGTKLAVIYFNEREPSGSWHPPLGKVIIVDLESGAVTDIPTTLDDFEVDWVTPIHWLSANVFLVTMHTFAGADPATETVAFLRYDLNDLNSIDLIEFDPCAHETVAEPSTHALLVSSECEPTNSRTIWAIDTTGKRVATDAEAAHFESMSLSCSSAVYCPEGLPTGVPTARVESVVGNALDGYGRFYENNWNRYYIYLNDRLVRVTDGSGWWGPVWNVDLELFIWDESRGTYYMDAEGHYRFWHNGDYAGKIPNCVVIDC